MTDLSETFATRRRRRRWPWVVLVLLAAGVAAAVVLSKKERPVAVQTARVERIPILDSLVTASGTGEARESVDIQAEIAGVIVDLPVREGDPVRKGQVLVRIDPAPGKADLQQAEATLAAAEAAAKGEEVAIAQGEAAVARDLAMVRAAEAEKVQAQVRLDLARLQLRRALELLAKGMENQDRVDSAEAEEKGRSAERAVIEARLGQYQAQHRASLLQVEQFRAAHEASLQRARASRAALDRAKDSLEKTTLYAPLDGLITRLFVEQGERAVPGILSNPQATLMTIANLGSLEAWLEVDETDIVRVARDNPVEVVVDALPEQRLVGEITEIGNSPVPSSLSQANQEGRDFLVKVRLLAPPNPLRPGMSCEGEIRTARREDVPVVPLQALVRREVPVDESGAYLPAVAAAEAVERRADDPVARSRTARKELEGVYHRDAQGRARFRPVRTGVTGEMEIELLDAELLGQEIVIGPYRALRNLKEGDALEVDNSRFQGFARRREQSEE